MSQKDLFEESNIAEPHKDAELSADLNSDVYVLPGLAGLYELSIEAYYSALFARMSGLPVMMEIARYIDKVAKTADRAAASKAAFDRGDPDVLAVLKAAYKAQHEVHRLSGLLRFNPDENGVYIARCAPDHFILPALAEHFTLRFGETPWAIVDEKRKICLYREPGCLARLVPLSDSIPMQAGAENKNENYWEELWRLYHRSVNNEGKKNLKLQRQFMPERYHKYLPEMKK